jgi:hypothetical protein
VAASKPARSNPTVANDTARLLQSARTADITFHLLDFHLLGADRRYRHVARRQQRDVV